MGSSLYMKPSSDIGFRRTCFFSQGGLSSGIEDRSQLIDQLFIQARRPHRLGISRQRSLYLPLVPHRFRQEFWSDNRSCFQTESGSVRWLCTLKVLTESGQKDYTALLWEFRQSREQRPEYLLKPPPLRSQCLPVFQFLCFPGLCQTGRRQCGRRDPCWMPLDLQRRDFPFRSCT